MSWPTRKVLPPAPKPKPKFKLKLKPKTPAEQIRTIKAAVAHRPPPDIPIGHRFGFLIVLAAGERVKGASTYLVRCDCGQEIFARRNMLRTGNIRSCGDRKHLGEKPPRADSYKNEVEAARAHLDRDERIKATAIYPPDRTPAPQESDLAIWTTWMT